VQVMELLETHQQMQQLILEEVLVVLVLLQLVLVALEL